MKDKIIIKGAKVHNLKNVDLEIPRDKLVVFTGLSGSGKSSLAFDTLYAEGQRRYVESLSAYARQFLGQVNKPEVESIEGLSPAISIDQKTTSRNPRSTVGTVTEVYDYLRLLYARVGKPHCPKCGDPITQQSVDQIVDRIMGLEDRTKILLLAPVVRGRKGTHEKILESIKKNGFVRARIDGEIFDLTEDEINLEKNKKHSIEAVVDRLVVKEGIERRLSDSLEMALKLAEGLVIVNIVDGIDTLYSEHFACAKCGISIEELAPRMFSFNSPFGKCDFCDGLGTLLEIDPKLVVPDKSLSLKGGAISSWGDGRFKDDSWTFAILKSLMEKFDFDLDTPFGELSKEVQDVLLFGLDEKLLVTYTKEGVTKTYNHSFEGEVNNLRRRYMESSSDYMKTEIENYMSDNKCPKCKGARLKPESLAVTVGEINIYDFTKLPIRDELAFITGIEFSEKDKIISEQIIKEIKSRLSFLINVGLDYLDLARTAGTLSGGESQRIRLATQIGSQLMGVLYILDEPSIGLHQRDNDKLIETLQKLRDVGNTLIVVEHDEDTMRAADYIVDIGPGAGEHGGEIIAVGTIDEIMASKKSLTGQYLRGEKFVILPEERKEGNGNFISIVGAKENNLKNVTAKIPLGVLTMITGVSGSGKSTLINDILYKGLASKMNKRSKLIPGEHKSIEGIEHIDKIIEIDQSPIGRTPRSNSATYTGTFDIIRDLFSQTTDAKMKGYKPGRFSFNVKGGRCESCSGDGIIRIEMQFLSDVYVPCEICKGKRYNRETLDVKYKGKNIADVLNLTVEDALVFFENIPRIHKKLQTLMDVGLGYIRLGQPSTQLSGGEAQRIKLAFELSKRSTGKTLYILDEPTTGLHIDDVNKLIKILQRLVEGGNSVVVIEHNLDMIKCADYIIDLGPEGGDKGGMIIATGTPEEIIKVSESYTGKYLTKYLK
ncbi:excinuclease ABC subunit UvrA [uncultured Clostridium sp.]|uniref:excinuclease ABC subunit UvrA n=1 Tax=uncultured Clostridium sp. TaxID=59620 RepID=UPI002614EAF5|nr:excinuclease ABC subunit UvrA [uncultured Clostridium sp.]